jgi:tetratricopeptide (TPR) repeat protein
LAQTHLFVGQFYYRRDSFLAAAHRFDQIMKAYPDKSVAPEALYYLALSYKEMGANDWASEKLILLAEKYPNSEAAQEGKSLLAKLQKTTPAPASMVATSHGFHSVHFHSVHPCGVESVRGYPCIPGPTLRIVPSGGLVLTCPSRTA